MFHLRPSLLGPQGSIDAACALEAVTKLKERADSGKFCYSKFLAIGLFRVLVSLSSRGNVLECDRAWLDTCVLSVHHGRAEITLELVLDARPTLLPCRSW